MSSTTSRPIAHPAAKDGDGDPLLRAVLKHDKVVADSRRNHPREDLKLVYDKHARLMEHERSGVVGVGHGMWYFDDMVGVPPSSQVNDNSDEFQEAKQATSQ